MAHQPQKSAPFESKAAVAPVVLGLPGSIQAMVEGALIFFAKFKEAIKEALLNLYRTEKFREKHKKDPRLSLKPVFIVLRRKIVEFVPEFNQDWLLKQWLHSFLDRLFEIRDSYLGQVAKHTKHFAVAVRGLDPHNEQVSDQQIADFAVRSQEAVETVPHAQAEQVMPVAPILVENADINLAEPVVIHENIRPEPQPHFVSQAQKGKSFLQQLIGDVRSLFGKADNHFADKEFMQSAVQELFANLWFERRQCDNQIAREMKNASNRLHTIPNSNFIAQKIQTATTHIPLHLMK